MDIRRVAVIGSGIMGNQIAMQTAIHGFDTFCYSNDPDSLKKASEFAAGWFEKRIAKGAMTWDESDSIQKRLIFTKDLERAVSDADIIIEAVPDVVEVKKKVLAEVDRYAPERAIYASNSSYIVSSKFCDAVRHPGHVVNFHFFNPALIMKVVEVVRGPHSSKETVDTVYRFAEAIGKTPVLVEKEVYGFVVNRIFSALTREACYLLDQGIASVEDIDKAVKGGLGHPMGPFELLDMTGIDLEHTVYMEKYRASGDVADQPRVCLTELYAKGEYGRKTGKGFYSYEKSKDGGRQ